MENFHNTMAGFAAGFTGTILGYPFDTVKTKMQTQGSIRTMPQTFTYIYQADGIRGFYRGLKN